MAHLQRQIVIGPGGRASPDLGSYSKDDSQAGYGPKPRDGEQPQPGHLQLPRWCDQQDSCSRSRSRSVFRGALPTASRSPLQFVPRDLICTARYGGNSLSSSSLSLIYGHLDDLGRNHLKVNYPHNCPALNFTL